MNSQSVFLLHVGSCIVLAATGLAGPSAVNSKKLEGEKSVTLQNLLSAELEGVKGTEVIVSRVTIPPNTSLPKHWHPGEEFAYVLEGSVTLWQKGKPDIVGKKGDVLKVPLKQVHTAITKEAGVTLLVFRVHALGQPERIKAE